MEGPDRTPDGKEIRVITKWITTLDGEEVPVSLNFTGLNISRLDEVVEAMEASLDQPGAAEKVLEYVKLMPKIKTEAEMTEEERDQARRDINRFLGYDDGDEDLSF